MVLADGLPEGLGLLGLSERCDTRHHSHRGRTHPLQKGPSAQDRRGEFLVGQCSVNGLVLHRVRWQTTLLKRVVKQETPLACGRSPGDTGVTASQL